MWNDANAIKTTIDNATDGDLEWLTAETLSSGQGPIPLAAFAMTPAGRAAAAWKQGDGIYLRILK